MTTLGDLSGGQLDSSAEGISPNGKYIVGSSSAAIGDLAFRGDSETGMTAIGELPGGGTYSRAMKVSDAGAVVGFSGAVEGTAAFLWTEEDGMRNVKTMLVEEYGLGDQVAGWKLNVAWDISADGRTIVGEGINPGGRSEGWVFAVPKPGSLPLGVFTALERACWAFCVGRDAEPRITPAATNRATKL